LIHDVAATAKCADRQPPPITLPNVVRSGLIPYNAWATARHSELRSSLREYQQRTMSLVTSRNSFEKT
jgi:hypothetical protein